MTHPDPTRPPKFPINRVARHITGRICAHCNGPQVGMAAVNQQPVCHPNYGMDCYRLVTVYGHLMPCDCRGPSAHPDNDRCYRCQFRRFEHLVDPAQPQRKDFLGNPVPCWAFLEYPIGVTYRWTDELPSLRFPAPF